MWISLLIKLRTKNELSIGTICSFSSTTFRDQTSWAFSPLIKSLRRNAEEISCLIGGSEERF
nr:MAG TPA: hypothetical protein [Caudoviricetes sp.]